MEIDQYIKIILKSKAKEMEKFKADFDESEKKSHREWDILFAKWILDKYSSPLSED